MECVDAVNIFEGEEAAMQGISEQHSYKHHVIDSFSRLLTFRSFAGINQWKQQWPQCWSQNLSPRILSFRQHGKAFF